MSIRSGFPDLPPVWAAGFALAEWASAEVLPIATFDEPLTRGLGAGLVVAGSLLAGWAAVWFARKKTSIEPGERPTALIVEGPFRINRNPIYTGMALVLLGIAVWLGALGAIAIAMIFPFVITSRFIRREEAALRLAFGPEADRYFGQTRRW